MKRLFAILLIFPVLLYSCSEEEDILPEQRTKIESYLKSTHTPALVPEADVEEDGQVPFYTTSGNTVYRYIDGYYNPERVNWREVTSTSKVTITFKMYVFSFTNIADNLLPEYSNDPALAPAYVTAGTDISRWPFVPQAIDLRSDDILKGLHSALIGCREGDVVETYMTYNMAYGDAYFSIIPRESPVALFFTVDSVE